MEYNKQIARFVAGDEIEGFYILRSAYIKTTAAGKPFLVASLADQSGTVDLKAWDYAGPVNSPDEGKIVKIRGAVSEYRGALQVIVEKIRLATESDDIDMSALVPTAPIDIPGAYAELEAAVEAMRDADYAAVCREMLRRHGKALRTIPAAKTVHHGFRSGLLMHTVNMVRLAEFLAAQYGECVNRDLLVAGTLLHDVAKAKEFAFSESGLVTAYTVPGQLLGHLVMGAQEVAEVAKTLGTPEEKSMLLQHMLLSHHGEPEFGAAVRPMCAEAELLSLIDLADSRMEIYREALEQTPVGQFSNRIFALDKRVFRHE